MLARLLEELKNGPFTFSVCVCILILCSLFVISLIWLFKKYKFFVQRLILYLSLSAFLSSIAYIAVSDKTMLSGKH